MRKRISVPGLALLTTVTLLLAPVGQGVKVADHHLFGASTALAAGCTGSQCDGQDPGSYGCRNGSTPWQTELYRPSDHYDLGTLLVYYSYSCDAYYAMFSNNQNVGAVVTFHTRSGSADSGSTTATLTGNGEQFIGKMVGYRGTGTAYVTESYSCGYSYCNWSASTQVSSQ